MRAIPYVRLRRPSGRYGQGLSIRSALRCAPVFRPAGVTPSQRYRGNLHSTIPTQTQPDLFLSRPSNQTNNFDPQAVIFPIMKVAFAPVYKYSLPEGHRFPMEKYDLLPQQLLYDGTLTESDFFHPQRLSEVDILKVHSATYWHKLKHQKISRKEERKIGFPMRADLVDRGRYIARGTYECAMHAMNDGVSLNIAGGTHHAFPDHGEGFCVFNDIAIASHMLLDEKKVKKLLIVDLDVHQGNGNADIFTNERRVFTFSMHGAKNYPLRKPPSDLDIPWPDGTTGGPYLPRLKKVLPNLINRVKPDLIFFQSGVDVLEADKLGRLSLSIQECMERDLIVFEEAHKHQIPIVATMGGGYSPRIAQIIDAHANTFRVARDLFF